jgi:hypothetical protein
VVLTHPPDFRPVYRTSGNTDAASTRGKMFTLLLEPSSSSSSEIPSFLFDQMKILRGSRLKENKEGMNTNQIRAIQEHYNNRAYLVGSDLNITTVSLEQFVRIPRRQGT